MKKYIDVFEALDGVNGLFTNRYGARLGTPFQYDDLKEEFGIADKHIVIPKQVHEDVIAIVGPEDDKEVIQGTDGLMTDVPGVVLTTVHADCLPVYIYDPVKNAIALVHAGWRGTNLGIAKKAVHQMEEAYGSRAEDMYAFVGPGISYCCFEVGPEVYEAFSQRWDFIDEFANHYFIKEEGFTQKLKYKLDLKGINQRELEKAGLQADHIGISLFCTVCDEDLFVSYRRECGTKMRMGAALWLD